MKIQSLGNSGLCLRAQEGTLLIDGIHCGEKVAFSPMSEEVKRDLQTRRGLFSHLTGILFTHDHPDHYDGELLSTYRNLPPVHGPGFGDAGVQPFLPGVSRVMIDNCSIWALDTVHDGAGFSTVPHQSYLVELDGVRVFVAGDAILGELEGHRLHNLCGGGIDAALLNPYQLLSPQSRAFLEAARLERVLLYHLPFPGADPLGCYALAARAAAQYPPELPPLVQLIPPMEVEILPKNSGSKEGGSQHAL